jgi:hypothetical protein
MPSLSEEKLEVLSVISTVEVLSVSSLSCFIWEQAERQKAKKK